MGSLSRILVVLGFGVGVVGYARSLFALTADPADSNLAASENLDIEDEVLVVSADAITNDVDDPTCGPRIDLGENFFRKTYRVTAYCDRGITAAGIPSGYGQCAAPADIPFGARIYIPELGQYFVVTDRTHRRFRHNTIDLFIPSKADCKQFGRRTLECEIELPAVPPRYGSPALARLIANRSF